MPAFQDLSGKKFNRLLVLKKDEYASKIHKRPYWLCQCDCGKQKSIAGISLKNGSTQSCGCLRNEKTAIKNTKNELGNRYGKLTVIAKDENNDSFGRAKWICECDCGNIKSVSGADLRSGNTSSCGCKNGISKGELKIQSVLEENNISYIREYKPKNLMNKRFDFAILNDNNEIVRLIEFDGEQHFKETKWGKEKLIRTQESDTIKNLYAFENGIPLIRIPYWEISNIDINLIYSNKFLLEN